MTTQELEAAITSISRRVDAISVGGTTVTRPQAPAQGFSLSYRFMSEAVTASATPTGGIVEYKMANVPSGCTLVLLQIAVKHSTLSALSPTVVTVRPAVGQSAITFFSLDHSALAGDGLTVCLWVPVSCGVLAYEMSGAPDTFALTIVGYQLQGTI